MVGTPFWSPFFNPGLPGREGPLLLKAESRGEFGSDGSNACPERTGVEVVRGIFCLRGSWSRLRMSLTDAADPCVGPNVPLVFQPVGERTTSAPPILTCFPGPLYSCILCSECGSHCKPEFRSKVGSLIPVYSGGIIITLSGNALPSSSSLSESAPKWNMFSLLLIAKPGDGRVP